MEITDFRGGATDEEPEVFIAASMAADVIRRPVAVLEPAGWDSEGCYFER